MAEERGESISSHPTSPTNAPESFLLESGEGEGEGMSSSGVSNVRSSFLARQLSFSGQRATSGEIRLVLLPYLVLLIDIFIYVLLRTF